MIFSDFELILFGAFLGIVIMYFRERIRNEAKDEVLWHLSRIIAGVADKEFKVERNANDRIEVIQTEENK
jgi:hypothetical protein